MSIGWFEGMESDHGIVNNVIPWTAEFTRLLVPKTDVGVKVPRTEPGRIVPRTEDERAAMESAWAPDSTIPQKDYEWKTLRTKVRFPLAVIRRDRDIVHKRMTKEVAIFKEKMRYVMGPFWTEEDAHRGLQASAGLIVDSAKGMKDTYQVTLRTTLKVYLPRLEEYLSELHDQEEDTEMNGTMKCNQFVFDAMALETPEQWEQVKAIPGELFQLPKVIIPARTIVAKDAGAAKKAIWAEAVKVEGVDSARLEVLVRPFCG